jgi:hypothetical protein
MRRKKLPEQIFRYCQNYDLNELYSSMFSYLLECVIVQAIVINLIDNFLYTKVGRIRNVFMVVK